MEEDYREKYKDLKNMFKALEQENSKVLSQLEKTGVIIKALQQQKNNLAEKLVNSLKKSKRNEIIKLTKDDEPKEE